MTLQDFAYTGNPITKQVYGSDLNQTVSDRNGNEVATLHAEQYGSMATIDFAAVLRTMFENTAVAAASGAQRTRKDYNLHVVATIASTSYILVRGVSQRSNVGAETFQFLTNMPRLRHYDGYPLSLSYIINNASRTYWSVQINGEHTEDNSALMALAATMKLHGTSDLTINPNTTQGDATSIYIHNGDEWPYLDDQSGDPSKPYRWGEDSNFVKTANRNPSVGEYAYFPAGSNYDIEQVDFATVNKPVNGNVTLVNDGVIRDSIQVIDTPVPVHPLYVRWINNRGGWDYFMFACQHKSTGTLTANDQYEKYTGYGQRYGQRSVFNKAATSAVETSTGIIDRQTLESVAELIYSPLIQMYDAEHSEWIEIQVKDGKSSLMATQPTGEMVFVFDLPTPQMNK